MYNSQHSPQLDFCDNLFLNQIKLEGLKIIEETASAVLNKSTAKKRGPKNREIVVDTTVTASPVAYPTDVNLLETCRKKCVEVIKKGEKTGKVTKKHRTRCRKARRDYVRHQKLGRKWKENAEKDVQVCQKKP